MTTVSFDYTTLYYQAQCETAGGFVQRFPHTIEQSQRNFLPQWTRVTH